MEGDGKAAAAGGCDVRSGGAEAKIPGPAPFPAGSENCGALAALRDAQALAAVAAPIACATLSGDQPQFHRLNPRWRFIVAVPPPIASSPAHYGRNAARTNPQPKREAMKTRSTNPHWTRCAGIAALGLSSL